MGQNAGMKRSARPASDGYFMLSLIGLALCLPFAVLAVGFGAHFFAISLGLIALYALPQLLFAPANQWQAARANFNVALDGYVILKLLALYLVLGLFGLMLHALSFYDQPRFLPTRIAYDLFGPFIAILAIPYFCTVHRMQADKQDEYYHVGLLFIGRSAEVDWIKVRHFCLGWCIKLFCFPLMFWELTRTIGSAGSGTFSGVSFASISQLVYIADVVIASAGYLFTLRLFGWQIRSVNPFLSGWFFTLLCYYPFFTAARQLGLAYEDGLIWSDWLANRPIWLLIWGSAILALKLCWIYAISPFGLRFSNLTNRGIITDGAFRWTKHPSYLSKNAFWWLIYIPFITNGAWQEAARNCSILFVMNMIYYCRAKTEERHLSEDPKYVEYARWIDEHGLFAVARRSILRTFSQRGLTAHS
jgi:protein-S-isoprenylcysteine O-methyltransferase Ste14